MTPYVVRLVRIEDYIVIENLKDILFLNENILIFN